MVDNEPQIMVFHPTMEEFKDMIGYINYMESQGAHKAGVAKIVPPKEWKPIQRLELFESDDFNDFVLEAPIKQDIIGDKGIGLSLNQVTKSISVKEYRKLANSRRYAPPTDFYDFEDLERKYWSGIHIGAPIYGADVSGSLSDAELRIWNIAHLPGILTRVDEGSIPGVTTPYLYYGMWKAGFAWHTEDLDLYSINYIHFGAPKQWYSVPPKYGWKLEALARSLFHTEYSKCKEFLRHKQCFISPSTLKENHVPMRKVVQECGEIMITFPYGYHAGYNLGFNVAESTNFATERWIKYGLAAKICRCKDDSVRINMEPFIKEYLSEVELKKFHDGESFIHPEDPNGTAIIRRNEACSRKRKRAIEKSAMKDGGMGDSENGIHVSPPEKIPKTTGCGRRKLHVTMDDDSEEESIPELSVPKEKQEKNDNAVPRNHRPKKSKRKKGRNSLQGSTNPPKFLKKGPIGNRGWMWTYADEERTDEDMEQVFEEEKKFNQLIGSADPHCCICAFSTDTFKRGDLLKSQLDSEKKNSEENEPSQEMESKISFRKTFTEPTIPESAFFKGPGVGNFNPHHYTKRESRLIECSSCHITVHARCYGARDLDVASDVHDDDCDKSHKLESKVDWICQRCEDGETRACCCLCPIRGGALKRTSCGRWAHVICIIASDPITCVEKAVRFGDVPNRTDVIIDPPSQTRRKFRCGYCRTNRSGHLASCCYKSCTDLSGCHVTCAYMSLAHMETGNHPHYFSLTCKHRAHRDIYEKLIIAHERQNLTPLGVGAPVLVEDTNNHNWYTGVVTKYEFHPEICHLEFPAGQVSTDTPINYVTRFKGARGPLEYGERVNVKWDDGETYVAIFLRKKKDQFYQVTLDSGTVLEQVSRIDIYTVDEAIPQESQSKIVGTWPPSVQSLNGEDYSVRVQQVPNAEDSPFSRSSNFQSRVARFSEELILNEPTTNSQPRQGDCDGDDAPETDPRDLEYIMKPLPPFDS